MACPGSLIPQPLFHHHNVIETRIPWEHRHCQSKQGRGHLGGDSTWTWLWRRVGVSQGKLMEEGHSKRGRSMSKDTQVQKRGEQICGDRLPPFTTMSLECLLKSLLPGCSKTQLKGSRWFVFSLFLLECIRQLSLSALITTLFGKPDTASGRSSLHTIPPFPSYSWLGQEYTPHARPDNPLAGKWPIRCALFLWNFNQTQKLNPWSESLLRCWRGGAIFGHERPPK